MSTECERLAAVLCAIASDRDHARQDPIWAAEADDLRAAAALLRASSAEPREPERVTDLEENAWGLIANANEGNWEAALPEWKDAAIRWREAYHAKLRGPQADTAGEADGWRPIESAPKDGTRILVGWTDPLLTEVAVWDEFHVRWEDPAGGCSFKPAPTHWQPLPPPPSEDPKP